MSTNKFNQPDFTDQDSATYKANIDGAFAILSRIAKNFQVRAQDVPGMSVYVEPGSVLNGTTLIEKVFQESDPISAPTTNPRIDRVVLNSTTGDISVVTGSEAATPIAPAIPSGDVPLAQIALYVGQISITNEDITDERVFKLG